MKDDGPFSEAFYQSGQIPAKVAGAQIVGRVFEILRLLSQAGADGARLKDLAASTGLSRPTVHRILNALVTERTVVQDLETRRYLLGPLIFELGLAAPQYAQLVQICRPVLERLAGLAGDTILLTARSGFDAVCVDRADGSFPIQSYVLIAGGRRPLGIGAAGLALLAGLNDCHVEMCLERQGGAIERYNGMTVAEVREQLAKTRRDGYGVSREATTLGVSGASVAVPSRLGAPYLAVSVGAMTPRIFGARFDWILGNLRAAADEIAQAIGV